MVGFIAKLLASLDLRFSDPKVESSYHNYYAQVKRDLLPTAIMVMLLVNILQSLITVLFFILPTPVVSSASNIQQQQQHYGFLTIPAILQFIVLIATCTFLKIARAESRHSDRRHSRHRLSSAAAANATQTAGAAGNPLSDNPASSVSSSSSYGSDDDDDDYDNQDEEKTEAIALKKRSSLDLEAAPKKFRRSMKNAGGRQRLALPYILWACQMLQLASGSWPLQSFISYSTLLLYSYTVYVIFPIRLMSCILLALGLSLSQPAIDYLLLMNFQPTDMTSMTSHYSKVSNHLFFHSYSLSLPPHP